MRVGMSQELGCDFEADSCVACGILSKCVFELAGWLAGCLSWGGGDGGGGWNLPPVISVIFLFATAAIVALGLDWMVRSREVNDLMYYNTSFAVELCCVAV